MIIQVLLSSLQSLNFTSSNNTNFDQVTSETTVEESSDKPSPVKKSNDELQILSLGYILKGVNIHLKNLRVSIINERVKKTAKFFSNFGT